MNVAYIRGSRPGKVFGHRDMRAGIDVPSAPSPRLRVPRASGGLHTSMRRP